MNTSISIRLSPRLFKTTLASNGLLLLLLCAYIVLTPSLNLLPVLGRYDEKRLLECLLLLFAGLNLLSHVKMNSAWIEQVQQLAISTRLLLGSMILIGLISSLTSTEPGRALLEVSLFLLLFTASIQVAVLRRMLGPDFDRFVANALMLASGFSLVAFATALSAAVIEQVPLLHWDLFVNFSHIRFFSQFQSWTLPLIVLPLLLNIKPTGMRLWLPLFLAGIWWFLLLSSGTRGTTLGLLVASVLTAVVFGRRAMPWFKWQGLALLVGLTLYIFVFMLPSLIGNIDTNAVEKGTLGRSLTNSSGRIHLWQAALTMIHDHPWLGVGPMHYACGVTNGIAAHPHNAVLQIAAEWGIPAALLVVLLVLRGTLEWIRLARQELNTGRSASTGIYPALLASLITAATHALFSGVIVMPLSQVSMVLVIGWMLGIYTAIRPQSSETGLLTTSRHRIWLVIPALAVIGLVAGISPDLMHFGEYLNTTHVPDNSTIYMPRFWQQGLICG